MEESAIADRQDIVYVTAPLLPMTIGETPAFITVKGTVTCVRRYNDSWYRACPEDNCGRKVKEERSGAYKCDKCMKISKEVRINFCFAFQS